MVKAAAAVKSPAKPATKKAGATKGPAANTNGAATNGAATNGAATKPKAVANDATKPKAATKAAKPKAAEVAAKAAALVASAEPPIELKNKRVVLARAVDAGLAIYAPGEKLPESLEERLELMRARLTTRIADLDEEHVLMCGDVDDPVTGCREVATSDVTFCPFCGDGMEEVVAEPEAPSAIVVGSATEAGLDAARTELEEVLARFSALSHDIAGNYYDIGLLFRQIRDRELWKARGHDTFRAFVEKELGVSKTSAYRYMDLTENYDRVTFLEVGAKKLELISGIKNGEERDAALDAARNGSTARELAGPATGGSREAPARERRDSSAPPAKKVGNEITLLAKVGAKPTLVPFRGAESGRPLKGYKPGAYAEFQLSDEVVLRVMMKEVKGSPGEFEGVNIAFVRAE